jgi:ribosome-associated toxin RatA of RatAB toxin-antitoxin module
MAVISLRRFILLLLFLFCCQAEAGEAIAAPEKQAVAVSVERLGEYFKVDASVILPVPRCQAFALLTDYASLPDFIPGMIKISFERLSKSKVKVRQLAVTEVLFFSIEMDLLLEMEEIPDRLILFKLIEGNMDAYSGVWSLLEVPEGTRLRYSASLKFDRYIPTFPGRAMLADEAEKRFEAVVREAVARKSRMHPNCTVAK